MRFWSTTVPLPSGVETYAPIFGVFLRRSEYASCSYFRQHISLPQVPDIFTGLSDILDLFENVDGKICESSSGVYKGVADGEYVVGLSYEDPCAQLVLDGAPVKIVYMKEGTVFLPASATIIKGAKNMDNAKLFIDFILSEEVQNIWGSTLTNRPVMKDAATNDAMTPMADINVIEEDIPYVSAHKSELVDKYTEIFTDLQSK